LSVLSLYIFRQIAQIFIILLAVLTGLVWVSQAIRFLNLVIEKGRSLGEFLTLTGYIVPSIMGLVAPTALFIATVFVLFRLNSDSELAVLQAAGGSQWSLLRPFMAAAAFVTAFVVFVNLFAMPYGMQAFREKLISVRTDLISTLVQEGQFVSPEAGLTVHIRAQDTNGDLLGLLFHDTRKADARVTYLAERARIVSSDAGTSLVMFNGTFQRRRETAKDVDVVRFEEYTLDLDTFGPDRKVPYYQASEKFLSELLNPDPKDPIFIDQPGKIIAELHERLSSPFYVITMMLIAFIGLSEANSNRVSRAWMILGVIGLATGVRLLGATSVNMLIKNAALYPLAYAIPLVAILSALTYLIFHNRANRDYHVLVRNRASRRRGPSRPAPAGPGRSTHMAASYAPGASAAPRPAATGPAPGAASPARASTAPPQRGPDPTQALRRLFAANREPGPDQYNKRFAADPRNANDNRQVTAVPARSDAPRARTPAQRPPSMAPGRPHRKPGSKPGKGPE